MIALAGAHPRVVDAAGFLQQPAQRRMLQLAAWQQRTLVHSLCGREHGRGASVELRFHRQRRKAEHGVGERANTAWRGRMLYMANCIAVQHRAPGRLEQCGTWLPKLKP